MPRIKRPTRAQKIALSKLSSNPVHEYRTAKTIGASEIDLGKCVDAKHAMSIIVNDVMRFCITSYGQIFLQNLNQKPTKDKK